MNQKFIKNSEQQTRKEVQLIINLNIKAALKIK